MSRGPTGSKLGVGYWPGMVDTYFDLYVAGVWNTSHTARLLLINLLLELSKILNNNSSNHDREHQDALRLVEDMVSSIPFHLAEDLHVFLRDTEKEDAAPKKLHSGRPIGALLLMHPIYVASKLSIVPPHLRIYLHDCPEWIAAHMGIGQALVFAKVRECLALQCGSLIIPWAPKALKSHFLGSGYPGRVLCRWMHDRLGWGPRLIRRAGAVCGSPFQSRYYWCRSRSIRMHA